MVDAIDAWTLLHVDYGILAAVIGLRLWPTIAIAFAWEWAEWSGAADVLAVLGVGRDSGGLLNSLADVLVAVLAYQLATALTPRQACSPGGR